MPLCFVASNRGQRLGYCFRSMCSLSWGRRGCPRGHCLRNLLLPCLLGRNLHNGLGAPFVTPVVTRSEAGL
jgi:hypothetical protein